MILTRAEIQECDRGYRRDFMNRLSGVKGAWVMSTFSEAHAANLGLFNSVTHIGANPPLMGVLFRPHTVERHSLENLRETRLFGLNALPEALRESAHRTSAKFERDTDDFEECGLSKK
jgi:flavin reductase (DIM6/NTAB) family NADH-FMN oxidoreductase RutF